MLSRWDPDKHLRVENPRLKMALRMTYYGTVVSSVGGFVFSLPFLLGLANLEMDNIRQALLLAVFFGGGTGLFRRLLASLLIGIAMAIVAGKFFKEITNPWSFKFAMGITTAAIVHLFSPANLVSFYISELTDGHYDPLLETATVIAVYAGAIYLSQVMAGKYMREISSMSQKGNS